MSGPSLTCIDCSRINRQAVRLSTRVTSPERASPYLAALLPLVDAQKAGSFGKCDSRQRDARLAHLSGRHLV
jgi:hypothetical protein